MSDAACPLSTRGGGGGADAAAAGLAGPTDAHARVRAVVGARGGMRALDAEAAARVGAPRVGARALREPRQHHVRLEAPVEGRAC